MNATLKQKIRKNWLTIVTLGVSLCAMLTIFFATDSMEALRELENARLPWLFAAFGCMAVYWLLEGVSLHILCIRAKKDHRFISSFITGMVGVLYSALTPLSTGGQPMQVVQMRKQGLTTGDATSVIALKTVLYQFALTFSALSLIALRIHFFQKNISDFSFLAVVAVSLSVLFIAAILLFMINRNLTSKMVRGIYKGLNRFHLLRDVEASFAKAEAQLELFHDSFHDARTEWPRWILVCALTVIEILASFLVPYCIYLAFGFREVDVVTIIAAVCFVQLLTMFVPLPGGSGGAEGGFYMFFRLFFPAGTIAAAIMLWRFFTYYLGIIVGGFFSWVGNRHVIPKEPLNGH